VWSAIQALVDSEDRRRALHEAIGIGKGRRRIKLLIRLREGPMTLTDIAEALAVDAPYATVVVDTLTSRGLARRTAHPDDNRRKLVELTPAGSKAAAVAEQILAKPPAALMTLSLADLAILQEVLGRLELPGGRPS
jgi:DNA-binding MarR family transcriptional regulator